MEEDRRAILLAPVGSLAIKLRGIVVLPEYFEQLVIGKLAWIVLNFDGFGVAGCVCANLLISWIRGVTADVANASGNHAGELAECGFDSPKTSSGKSSFRHKHDSFEINYCIRCERQRKESAVGWVRAIPA